MTSLQALLLAIIQGATEFLPISSSAHLILVPRVLGWEDQGLVFDVVTHAGSMLAVLIYFRRDLRDLTIAFLGTLKRHQAPAQALSDPSARLAWTLLPASLPLAAAGWLAYGWIASGARSPAIIATASIVFGLLLAWADWISRGRRDLSSLTLRDALLIGVAQALALIPGTSRSGVTITAGLALGFSRKEAARYSFLLSVPAGLMVTVKDVIDLATSAVTAPPWTVLLVGFFVSAATAYVVIDWLLGWLERQNMMLFVVYRVLLGLLIFGLF